MFFTSGQNLMRSFASAGNITVLVCVNKPRVSAMTVYGYRVEMVGGGSQLYSSACFYC